MGAGPGAGPSGPVAPVGVIQSRLPELLEAVKQEFEGLAEQQLSTLKSQRDEYEHKLASQINELSAFQQSLYELERAHQKIKAQYEEEILRLRRDLEARGIHTPQSALVSDIRGGSGPVGPGRPSTAGTGGGAGAQGGTGGPGGGAGQTAAGGFPDGVPPPVLGSGQSAGGGVFGALMSQGPPQPDHTRQQPYMNGTPNSSAGAPPGPNANAMGSSDPTQPVIKRMRGEDGPLPTRGGGSMGGGGGPDAGGGPPGYQNMHAPAGGYMAGGKPQGKMGGNDPYRSGPNGSQQSQGPAPGQGGHVGMGSGNQDLKRKAGPGVGAGGTTTPPAQGMQQQGNMMMHQQPPQQGMQQHQSQGQVPTQQPTQHHSMGGMQLPSQQSGYHNQQVQQQPQQQAHQPPPPSQSQHQQAHPQHPQQHMQQTQQQQQQHQQPQGHSNQPQQPPQQQPQQQQQQQHMERHPQPQQQQNSHPSGPVPGNIAGGGGNANSGAFAAASHQYTGLCELNVDTEIVPAVWKKEGSDWFVIYNPKSPSLQKTRLNVDLVHTLVHDSGLQAPEEEVKGDLYVRSICFSPDSNFIASGAEDRAIRVWDICKNVVKWTLIGHDQDIYSLDWSKDGRYIVSGSGDRTVKVWDNQTGKCVMTLHNEEDKIAAMGAEMSEAEGAAAPKDAGVTSVAISPINPRCVVAGSLDKMIRVWDIQTGQLLERFEGHTDSVYSVAFSPDGLSIVSGSLDQTLKIWDLSSKTLNYLAKRTRYRPSEDGGEDGGAPSPSSASSSTAASATENGTFETLVTTKCRHTFAGHRDFVLSVAFAGLNGSMGRVDENGDPVATTGGDALAEVEWVVSGSKDRTVTFWDGRAIPEGRPGADLASAAQFMLQGHKNSVISVALANSGGLFATASGDCRARIWRVSADRGGGPLPPAGPVSHPAHPGQQQQQQQQGQQQQQSGGSAAGQHGSQPAQGSVGQAPSSQGSQAFHQQPQPNSTASGVGGDRGTKSGGMRNGPSPTSGTLPPMERPGSGGSSGGAGGNGPSNVGGGNVGSGMPLGAGSGGQTEKGLEQGGVPQTSSQNGEDQRVDKMDVEK
ncbi:general transcription repressor [Quaeritorhiza haematococci]|nr:general transcription repressor [Quaeritorhiza haematococci]